MPRKKISQSLLQRRQSILSELEAIPALPESAQHFLTPDGFLEYFNRICDCFPSKREAYETLEDIHEHITGRRKYSEYDSFRVAVRGKC